MSYDRLDARVRAALVDDRPGVAGLDPIALDQVLARSQTRRRRHRALQATVLGVGTAAVVAVVAAVGPGLLGGRDTDRVPGPAVSRTASAPVVAGSYTREVKDPWGQTGDGTWGLRLLTNGVLEVEPPPGAKDVIADGASYAVSGDRLSTDLLANGACYLKNVGTYRWSRSGDLLTLTVVSDECVPRADIMGGTWRLSVSSPPE